MGVRLLQDGVAFLQGVLGGAEGLGACSQVSPVETPEGSVSTSLDSYQEIVSSQPWTAVSVQSSAVKWFDPELCEIDPNETSDASVPEKLQLFEEKLLQAEEYVALSYQDASVLKQFNTSAGELQSEALALADEVLGLAKQDPNPEIDDRNWYLYFRKEMLELAIKEFELQQLGGADSQVLVTRQGEIQKGKDRVIQGLKSEARGGNWEAESLLLREAQLQALTVWATYEQEREKLDPTKNALFVRISELVQSGKTQTLQGAVAFLLESSASEDQVYKSYLSEVQSDRLIGKLLYLTSDFPFPYNGEFSDAPGDNYSPRSLALKLEAEGGYIGTAYQLHGLTKIIDLENKVQKLVDAERLSLEGKQGFWSDFGRGAYHAIRTTSLPEVALFHALPLGIALRVAGKAQAAKLTSLAAKGSTGLPAVAMGQGIRFGVAGGLLWGWNTATMAGGAWVQGKDLSKVLTPKALGMGLLSSILSIAGIELSGKLGTQIGMKSASKLKWASVENGIPNLTFAGTTLTQGMHHLFAYSGMTGTHWMLNWHIDGTSAGRGLVDYWAFPMAMKANEVFFPAMAKSGRRLHQEIAYLEQALMRPMVKPSLALLTNTVIPAKTYAIEPMAPLTENQRAKANEYFDKWNEKNIFGGKAERNWMAMAVVEDPAFKSRVGIKKVLMELRRIYGKEREEFTWVEEIRSEIDLFRESCLNPLEQQAFDVLFLPEKNQKINPEYLGEYNRRYIGITEDSSRYTSDGWINSRVIFNFVNHLIMKGRIEPNLFANPPRILPNYHHYSSRLATLKIHTIADLVRWDYSKQEGVNIERISEDLMKFGLKLRVDLPWWEGRKQVSERPDFSPLWRVTFSKWVHEAGGLTALAAALPFPIEDMGSFYLGIFPSEVQVRAFIAKLSVAKSSPWIDRFKLEFSDLVIESEYMAMVLRVWKEGMTKLDILAEAQSTLALKENLPSLQSPIDPRFFYNDISELAIPIEIRRRLFSMGIKLIGDLVQMSGFYLIKRFSPTAVRNLSKSLAVHGLNLGMYIDGWGKTENIRIIDTNASGLSKPISVLNLNSRVEDVLLNILYKMRITTLADLVRLDRDSFDRLDVLDSWDKSQILQKLQEIGLDIGMK